MKIITDSDGDLQQDCGDDWYWVAHRDNMEGETDYDYSGWPITTSHSQGADTGILFDLPRNWALA